MKVLKSIIFVFTLLCVACEEVPDNENPNNNPNNSVNTDSITYPEKVIIGNNILALDDSSDLVSDDSYELGAVLGKDANLKLVITNLSTYPSGQMGPIWFFDMDSQGWSINDYNESSNYQVLTSTSSGKIYAVISFDGFGYQGECRIDFYENSDTITQSKYFFWE